MDLTPLELNEIATRVDMTNVRKLGYHLGFDHGQVKRFEHANNLNPSQCTGTEDMLMTWHGNGGTREQLCEALRRVEQSRLAVQIQGGEFQAEPVGIPHGPRPPAAAARKEPEASLHPSSSQSQSNNEQRAVAASADLEQILPNLASDLTQEQFERLGLALGFKNAAMNRFSSTNFITGRLTTRGTLDMLYEWRSRTAVGDQKPQLRAAMVSLGLRTLADEYLPQA